MAINKIHRLYRFQDNNQAVGRHAQVTRQVCVLKDLKRKLTVNITSI